MRDPFCWDGNDYSELSICPMMRRTLLAFASETVSKDMRTRATRRGYVFAAARIEIGEAYALGGPMKDQLRRWPYSDGDCSHTLHAALPWSPTDVPVPSAWRRCTVYREGCSKRKPFAAVISIRSRQCLGNARTCNRRRLSRRKPASAGGTRASRLHDVRNGRLTSRRE